MKLFYTICLILSSFFNINIVNAIFIPDGAIQDGNVPLINIDTMVPNKSYYSPQTTNNANNITTSNTQNETMQQSQQRQSTTSAKNTQTYKSYSAKKTKTINKTATTSISTKQTQKNTLSKQEISNRVSKYTLDSNTKAIPKEKISQEPQIKLSQIEIAHQKSISELFDGLAPINRKDPSFKQAYANYAMELKVLYNKKEYKTNSKQEKTLAKANSIRSFTVD